VDVLVQPLAAPVEESLSITIQHPTRQWCEPVVMTLAGSLNQHTTRLVGTALGEALLRRPAVVLLSLSRVTAVDPSGLSVLLAAAHTVALSDGRLRTVAAPGEAAFHAITSACLTRRLALHRTLADALAE
jgi:anti-anti-sigma regulatory factor